MLRYSPVFLLAATLLAACSTTEAEAPPPFAGTTSPTASTGTMTDGKGTEAADKISAEAFDAANLPDGYSQDTTYACSSSGVSGHSVDCYCPRGMTRAAETAVASVPVLWDSWTLSPRGAYAVTTSNAADPYTVDIYLSCQ